MGNQRRDEWPNLDDKPSGTSEGGATGSGGKSDVTGELQELGQRLAATARALWQSEQRQELQQEVTDGLRLLRDQLSGAVDTVRLSRSGSSHRARVKSVFTSPGATQLMRTLRGLHSTARLRVSCMSAALEMP